MTDPRPIDTPPIEDQRSDFDREAKIDELLLAGLEQYFDGRYQDAINVWGRVLFLDRGHPRARAYIERARSALAERQRTTEELVQEGVAALDRGDNPAARRLLTTALAMGEPHDMAQTYLDRAERLSPPPAAEGRRRSRHDAEPKTPAHGLLARTVRPVRALPILAAAIVVGTIIIFAASRDLLRPLVARNWRPAPAGSSLPLAADPLPAPRPSEVALGRARELYRSGHLKAALASLDGVSDADPLAPDAVRLRAELQRVLLEPRAAADAGEGAPARGLSRGRPAEVRQ